MDGHQKNEKDKIRTGEWAMILFTAGIFATSVVAAIIFSCQLGAMKGQLAEMRSGSTDTHKLAEAANLSASITKESYDTGKRAQLSVMSLREIFLSVKAGAGAVFQPSADDRIGKPLEQVRTGGADTRPSNDDHDEIYLVFRNLSHRPTAVLDIRVKDKGGKDLGGRGYKRQIMLPVKIGPWDAEGRDIRIENNDATRMAYIEIQDIDENIFVVRPTTKWTYAKLRK